MHDNCGEWVECMGVANGSGWYLWVWLQLYAFKGWGIDLK